MQSKLDVLTARVNEVEERVSDIEDKLMERKEAKEKREKQRIAHEERFQELSEFEKEQHSSYWDSRGHGEREDQKVC